MVLGRGVEQVPESNCIDELGPLRWCGVVPARRLFSGGTSNLFQASPAARGLAQECPRALLMEEGLQTRARTPS